jgi:hypothetical protein
MGKGEADFRGGREEAGRLQKHPLGFRVLLVVDAWWWRCQKMGLP